MIIHFNQELHWHTTDADLDTDNPRRYYASPPQHLAVLVLMPEVADECDGVTWLHGHKFDCNIGVHAADAPVGYTLPQFAGYEHSKLTLRSVVDDATPHQMTLSDFLAGCPTTEHLLTMRHRAPIDLEPVKVRLPPILVAKLRDMAARRDISLDVLAWDMLLDYATSHP